MISRGHAAAAWALLLLLLGAAVAQHEGNVSEEYAASFASRYDAPPSWAFPNPRLRAAYAALQAWKQTAIFSDPSNFTASWVGANVCAYNGVYCAPSPGYGGGGGGGLVVAGIDLNHADIAGYLPASLPLGLPDLALIHLNSNRFCGVVPDTFRRLRLLHELDLSNNRFVGAFPEVVLALPSLRYLDLRFNDFEGSIPPALFDRPLDAIFLNSNRLRNPIPANLGNSPASVVLMFSMD
uniref:Cell wall hydroxyproline-rich glycoprotein n=1 Tax=Oryza barthii TaxID=65489 RepID=A0A0D3F0G3_9ORYZ